MFVKNDRPSQLPNSFLTTFLSMELGNRERGSYSLKMTALLYYLINSLLLFLLLLAKITGNELGNRERLSF